jgi:cysteine synthase A
MGGFGRGGIYKSILETIGNTPLVRASRLTEQRGLEAEVLLKVESFNPVSSVKDRVALGLILALEDQGAIREGTTIIEPTSGNTGIGLAFACAVRGYPLIVVMPSPMSIERRKMMTLLGATIELTEAEQGMQGAMQRAQEILDATPNACIPSQFTNKANPAIHRLTTAEEIWHDTKGAVDVIVAGVGTGGTVTGIAQALKPRKPGLKLVAVEPEESQVLAGGKKQPHGIQGIGPGFVPEILDLSLIDEIVPVDMDASISAARNLARTEGIPCGISSGAALAAAMKVAERPAMKGKMIVVILPDSAERYISTALFG